MSENKEILSYEEEKKLGKNYDPASFENEIYRFWEQSGCFDAADENAPDQKAFCIVLPPPNVTGVLHIGHALTGTIQDILIRWRRMRGDNTLWLPGTDHAGIATQTQVEKAIAKEGKGPSGKPLTRYDLGREKFLERTWQWKEEHGNHIGEQQKRLGNSLDWKRERFTMDEGCSRAVREVFVTLYEQGLLYRGKRIINWDVKSQTALSDLEVVPTDRKAHLWHIRYPIFEDEAGKTPLKDEKTGEQVFVTIATTRPETLLADTAVAIHPEDERFLNLHGKFAKVPLVNRMVKMITDDYVDREFGTGSLKITPGHDFNDYEIGVRHNLEMFSVMSKDGKVTLECDYKGMKFQAAREKVVEDLKAAGLLVKIEDYSTKIGISQRSGEVVEPILSEQWFVDAKTLAQPAIKAVENGDIVFYPKTWEKTYFEWMYNIRDWCVSRQLWWGHQIPAWYCDQCEKITVSKTDPTKCSHCDAPQSSLRQDEDVLDTWFSSALWPFSTLGWPEKTQALKTFYPGAILETGFDIIFFWVARMIMMGIHFMGDVPFRRVYLHAMVRDGKGEKMSKSKGNVIDPLNFIEEKGADPLRFTLAIMAGQGRDVKLSEERINGYRLFCNKLWNATKYFLMQKDEFEEKLIEKHLPEDLESWVSENLSSLRPENRWIISRFQESARLVNTGLERFELNIASQAVYDFGWHELCDWYIELSKLSLREKNQESLETLFVLHYVLEQTLKLSHPFMPFLTEKLWQALPWKKPVQQVASQNWIETLMLQTFPEESQKRIDLASVKEIESLKTMVESIRNFRGENQISPKKKIEIAYSAKSKDVTALISSHQVQLISLCQIESLVARESGKKENEAVVVCTDPAIEFYINLEGLVDKGAEASRLKKEIKKLQGDIAHVERKLSNQSFVQKAPAKLVDQEKQKKEGLQLKLDELEKALQQFEARP